MATGRHPPMYWTFTVLLRRQTQGYPEYITVPNPHRPLDQQRGCLVPLQPALAPVRAEKALFFGPEAHAESLTYHYPFLQRPAG